MAAGLKAIWLSDAETVPTTTSGQISGFTSAKWYRYASYQNGASYLTQYVKYNGGLVYNHTITYELGSLSESALQSLENISSSLGYSIVIETANNEGYLLTQNSWVASVVTNDRTNVLVFRSTSTEKPRQLQTIFFERFIEPPIPEQLNAITIQERIVTIQGRNLTTQ